MQLGEEGDGGPKSKPKRSGIPKGTDKSDVDLELALKLLALPREVGQHPEDGKKISANFGRFGPYVVHNGIYASLDSPEDVFEIGLNRAVTLIAEKKARGPGRRGAQTLKDLGESGGKPIKVLKGKFGPYVSDGETNATLPEGTEPESVTLEQALAWIAERAAKGGKKKKATRKAAAPKKAAAKKAAPKKAAAKKKAAPKKAAKKATAKTPKKKAAGSKAKEPELTGE